MPTPQSFLLTFGYQLPTVNCVTVHLLITSHTVTRAACRMEVLRSESLNHLERRGSSNVAAIKKGLAHRSNLVASQPSGDPYHSCTSDTDSEGAHDHTQEAQAMQDQQSNEHAMDGTNNFANAKDSHAGGSADCGPCSANTGATAAANNHHVEHRAVKRQRSCTWEMNVSTNVMQQASAAPAQPAASEPTSDATGANTSSGNPPQDNPSSKPSALVLDLASVPLSGSNQNQMSDLASTSNGAIPDGAPLQLKYQLLQQENNQLMHQNRMLKQAVGVMGPKAKAFDQLSHEHDELKRLSEGLLHTYEQVKVVASQRQQDLEVLQRQLGSSAMSNASLKEEAMALKREVSLLTKQVGVNLDHSDMISK